MAQLSSTDAAGSSRPEPAEIRAAARRFAGADDRRAGLELGATLVAYALGLGTALAAIGTWWLAGPAMVLAAVAGLRAYMIQHDCFHGSFFRGRWANEITGTLLSALSMTPFRATRYIHNRHHAHVSDLDRRDTFEIYVMTLAEWEAAGPWERLRYRLYRSPLTLIFVGPFVLYTLLRRFPACTLRTGLGDVLLHNALLAAMLAVIYALAGWPGLGVWAGALYIACVTGALIPYVVHNFEQVHWGTRPELDFQTAALEGSCVLDWGRGFDLAMMNIGYHDLHHLNAMIPGYRLRAAHDALVAEGLLSPVRVGFLEGMRCLRWKLYDADRGRMIPFPPSREGRGAAAAPS